MVSHGWQSTRWTSHSARTADLLYTACVKDPIGLFNRLKFTAPDCVRPRLQTAWCERSLRGIDDVIITSFAKMTSGIDDVIIMPIAKASENNLLKIQIRRRCQNNIILV